MFRAGLGKVGVAGTAAAAAAATSKPAQCREAQPVERWSRFGLAKEEAVGVKGATANLPHTSPEPLSGEWLLTQLSDNNVVFSAEEINETANAVLSLPLRAHPPATRIMEVDVNGVEYDTTDTESNASDVNEYMQAADSAINASRQIQRLTDTHNSMLQTLLHNEGVQRACMDALARDVHFVRLLQDVDQSGPLDVPVGSLLPPAARAASSNHPEDGAQAHEGDENPFAAMMASLAQSLKAMGENLAGLRDALGGFFIDLGNRLHALLGQPFGQTPLQEVNSPKNPRAEVVGNALITVACAILALVLVKRVHRVRFV